jgi:hypothetical protein
LQPDFRLCWEVFSNVGATLRRRARRAKALFFKEGLVLLVRNFGLCPRNRPIFRTGSHAVAAQAKPTQLFKKG